MPFGKRIDRHMALMTRMGRALGADPVGSVMAGDLSAGAYRAAVLNCTACREADACEGWLETHEAGAEAAPSYCRNKALLEALRP